MRIIISKHARYQMEQRGIEGELILKALKRGSKTKQTNGYLSVYCYVAVAYKFTKKGDILVKTVMIQ